MTDPQTRHKRGLIAVVVLALIFFTILALIVLKTGDEEPEKALAGRVRKIVNQRAVRIGLERRGNARIVVCQPRRGGHHRRAAIIPVVYQASDGASSIRSTALWQCSRFSA